MPSELQMEQLILQNEIEDLITRFDEAVIRNDRAGFRTERGDYQHIWVDIKTSLDGESVPPLKTYGAVR